MMKRYVIAFYSNFDGSMRMEEVLSTSQVQAGKDFLKSEDYDMLEEIKTYDQLQERVFAWDHAIGVYEINNSRAGRSGPGLQTQVAQFDSAAGFH